MLGIARRACLAATLAAAACRDDGSSKDCGSDVETLFQGSVVGANLAMADGMAYFATDSGGHAEVQVIGAWCGTAALPLWAGGDLDAVRPGMSVGGDRLVFVARVAAVDPGTQVDAVYSVARAGGDGSLLYALSSANPGVVADADHAYTVDRGRLLAIPLSGGTAVEIASVEADQLAYANHHIYAASAAAVQEIDPASGQLRVLATSLFAAGTMAIDAAAVYLPVQQGIAIVPLDGSPAWTVPTGLATASAVLAGDGVFYVVIDDALARVPRVGGEPQVLVDHLGAVQSLSLYDGAVYAAAYPYGSEPGRILRIQASDIP